MLAQLLDELSPREFLDQFFHRLPYSVPGGAKEVQHLGTWETLGSILTVAETVAEVGAESDAGIDSVPDVMVVKSNARWTENRTPTIDEAKQLHADGYTILVKHAERHHAGIAGLATGFETDFRAPVDVHLYCTPGSEYGFGWHYDAEDVFILQATGAKEYSLRKNTVNPWPLEETLPADMQYERELMPLIQCLLEAGDWLYIPNGYWHKAEAKSETAISLAVGVMTPSGISALDFLRKRLLHALPWRQRLPVAGAAAEQTPETLLEQYQQVFAELGDQLAAELKDPAFVRTYLQSQGVKLPWSSPGSSSSGFEQLLNRAKTDSPTDETT